MNLEELPQKFQAFTHRLIHGKPKPNPRTSEGPVFATFQDRLFASAMDMGVLYLLFSDVLQWISRTVYQGINETAFAPLPEELASAPIEMQVRHVVNQWFESGFVELWLLNSFIQSILIGVVLIAVWTQFNSTPGKFIVGLRFASKDGEGTPDFRQYLWRYAGFYLSMPIFMIGFAWLGFDRQKRAWHDRIAGTTVIYTKEGHIMRRGWELLKRFVKERYGKQD